MTAQTEPEGHRHTSSRPTANADDAGRPRDPSVEQPAPEGVAVAAEAAEPDLTGPFAVLLEDVLRRLDRVEVALRDVSHRYTGRIEDRSYRAFIEALKLAAQGMRQLVRQRERDFTELKEYAARRSAYMSLGGDGTAIEEQLEDHLPDLWVERPDELQVFAAPFTRLAKGLLPNIELLFFSWPYPGYEADVYDVNQLEGLDGRLAENLERVFGGDVKIIKLWHPATREKDIFHHAVFAHELAHALIQQEVPEEALEKADRPGEDDDPAPTFETVASGAFDRPAGLTGDQEERLLPWFREIACDIVAMRLIGPAFAVAFAEATSSNRTLEPVDSIGEHPPADFRFLFLREELAVFGFAPGTGEIDDLLYRYTQAYPHRPGEQDEEIPGALEWLVQAVGKFRSYLPRLLKGCDYQVDVFRRERPLVFELADRGVPPVERIIAVEDLSEDEPDRDAACWSEPLDWRSILNGMLLWHLRKQGFPTVEGFGENPEERRKARERASVRVENRELASRLAVGGIELSEFHTRAVHLREQYRQMRLDEELEERMNQ